MLVVRVTLRRSEICGPLAFVLSVDEPHVVVRRMQTSAAEESIFPSSWTVFNSARQNFRSLPFWLLFGEPRFLRLRNLFRPSFRLPKPALLPPLAFLRSFVFRRLALRPSSDAVNISL